MVPVRSSLRASLLFSIAVPGALRADAESPDGFGMVVVAHGGDEAWNRSVRAAVERLRARYELRDELRGASGETETGERARSGTTRE